jgi:putative AdoMet-dependent methyltransferase
MTDLFKEKSADWDAREMVQQLSAAVGAAVLEHVPLSESMSVMDFGAGTGLISAHIAPRVREIVALDTSQSMLDKLTEKPALAGKVRGKCHDILDAPLSQKFDVIVSAMALHHVEDTERLITVFAEHLTEGGRIALADLDAEDGSFHPEGVEGVYHAGFEREPLRSLLEKHGFTGIRFVTAHTVHKGDHAYPVFLVLAVRA